MTTKTRQRKVAVIRPPREIQEQTQARRQWLAAAVARLEAQPDTVARIVGSGSYQRVIEYRLEQVAARVQKRGVCQFCGGEWAVVRGRVADHGYERVGYHHGTCAGAGLYPANTTVAFAETVRESVEADLRAAEEAVPVLTERVKAAKREAGLFSEERKAAERALREAEGIRHARQAHLRVLDEVVLPALGRPLTEVLV